jgi:hypothetical protein
MSREEVKKMENKAEFEKTNAENVGTQPKPPPYYKLFKNNEHALPPPNLDMISNNSHYSSFGKKIPVKLMYLTC